MGTQIANLRCGGWATGGPPVAATSGPPEVCYLGMCSDGNNRFALNRSTSSDLLPLKVLITPKIQVTVKC